MKINRSLKTIFIIIFSLILIVLLLPLWIILTHPKVEAAETMTIDPSSERISRGEYLAWHVMQCMDCHSKRDFSYFSGPPIIGSEGAGGEIFNRSMGFPGIFISPNITPFGIGDWSDGELFRLITTGVKKDGKAIFPIMPYHNYGQLDPEDIKSVIAYIRQLPADTTQQPVSKADFPMNIIMRTLPQKATLRARPPASDSIAYGEYMVIASGCGDCHTSFDKGKYTGPFLAGGRKFNMPDGSVITSFNLTPDESGLKNWSKKMFIDVFKQYEDPDFREKILLPGQKQTIMPWIMYSGMTEKDLSAIFDYLQSLEPVKNDIVAFIPPPKKE